VEALKSQHLFTIELEVGKPQVLAGTPVGERRIVQVLGGRFEGPKIKGTVQGVGGDWIVMRPDGATQLDVRLTLVTDDDHLVYMIYRGIRHGPAAVMERLNRGEAVDPNDYYFRIAPFFETGSEKYGWLNRIVAVGVGDRKPGGPVYVIHEIL